MTTRLSCATCRKQFTPRRGTRRRNCYSCRPERLKATESTPQARNPELGTEGEATAAVRAELAAMDPPQHKTIAGIAAIRLARVLDDPRLGAAQVSSITAQLLRTVEPLKVYRKRAADELDEFTRRAQEKARAAGAEP